NPPLTTLLAWRRPLPATVLSVTQASPALTMPFPSTTRLVLRWSEPRLTTPPNVENVVSDTVAVPRFVRSASPRRNSPPRATSVPWLSSPYSSFPSMYGGGARLSRMALATSVSVPSFSTTAPSQAMASPVIVTCDSVVVPWLNSAPPRDERSGSDDGAPPVT